MAIKFEWEKTKACLKAMSRAIWLGACLMFFGCVIGLMAALNEQVGSTSTLIAALFTLVGGSLASLYRPPSLADGARDWIVQAAGLISLGLLSGFGLGFYLRYIDQARLMTGIARSRAELDRELRTHGQHLADYWSDSKDKSEQKSKPEVAGKEPSKPIVAPVSSLRLRAGVDQLSNVAAKALTDTITRLENQKPPQDQEGASKQFIDGLKTHRDVISNPHDFAPDYWFVHLLLASEQVAGLKGEDSTRQQLRNLREQGVDKNE